MNKMQEFFMHDSESKIIVDNILDVLHNDLTLVQRSKVKIDIMYDWVTLKSGKVSIGIMFHHGLMGRQKMSDFVRAYRTGYFRVWRFYDDSKYDRDTKEIEIEEEIMIAILKTVPRPTPKEMYTYYYSD